MTEDTSLREKDRIQGMVRSINQYRNGDPKAICAGSDEQILYAMTDARHDVLVLWDFAVAAGIASEAKDRRIEALEADKAELKKQLAAERKPDFFWDYNDPECSYDSPDEAIAQADMGSVVRLFTGKSLPQIWATTRVLTVDENGDWDDHEVAVFDNEADAKRCWPESLAAARAALSGKEGQS